MRAGDCIHFRGFVIIVHSNVHRHIWKHRIDEFECECDIEFRTFKEKHSHIMQVHQGKEMRECPICKKFLRSKESFETHLRLRHKTKEETVCLCGKVIGLSM